MDASGIHLVIVLTDDLTHRLWAAATPREQAVDSVLEVIPEGWTARLINGPQHPWMVAGVSGLAPGEVRELTGMSRWQAKVSLSLGPRERLFFRVLPYHPG
ncbi:hypothetical protein [Bradyrhizobium erythrophlei]|jgi:hypothetical protein|uniref:Uncharacterized protein n=1 Tax=Bradyrhizobium erythrophlei TaxID=1437360 RepID=A0A1M7UD17_9BRAD|nr:hypothetical protein [Bradyrhizobium erythrophlei]SHN80825.1 hypothetical protein SAMN05444170_4518 [Bradyrhizobium erythrophlei]